MRVGRGEGLLFLLVDVPIHSVVLTVSCLAGLTVRRGLLALAWIWIGHNALLTQAGTHCPRLALTDSPTVRPGVGQLIRL
jgi:hypothetical protein